MKYKRIKAVLMAAAVMGTTVLGGCGTVSKQRIAAREDAIRLLESGDYEGAVREFEELIRNASSVTEFELDILKYRAEAEYRAGDYEAASYTYDILCQVDGEKPEYYYFSALAAACREEIGEALNMLEAGKNLDPDGQAAGLSEVMEAIGESCNRNMLAKMEEGLYEDALEICENGKVIAGVTSLKKLKYNEAVCYEYLGKYEEALSLFRSYVEEFGSDEKAEHEIAFLATR